MKITFRRGYLTPAGVYNAGEGADFPDPLARELVSLGIAMFQEEPQMPIPAPSVKTVSTPAAHKQITTPKAKKGAAI